jgi:hypothetical protein
MESEPETEDSLLDDSWIVEFNKTHELYQDYCKDDLYYTNLHFIYVNKNNEIEKIKQDSFLMSSCNSISRTEVIGLLKRNSVEDNVKYSILSILRYNITLDAEDIHTFMKNNDNDNDNDSCNSYDYFLTPVKNIDAIKFEQTIHMFQDLNDLLFLFYEKVNDSSSNTHNVTKRVFFTPHTTTKHKKTHRRY